MIKVDLHSHSIASHDGGISPVQYQKALQSGLVDYIAVTDHNSIDIALNLQQQLGEQIIVGEEIMTSEGEIVGLFLKTSIEPGLSPAQTVKAIKDQGGLVYIPHPFETIRKGLHPSVLEQLAEDIDIIEVANGRAFAQNRAQQAVVWARVNHIPGAASSDAHGYKGLGKSYTVVHEPPHSTNLKQLITEGTPIAGRPSLRGLLYPKYHKLRKKVGR